MASNGNEGRAAGVDPAAWVDRYGDLLYRYALPRVRNQELAEELVQETFLAALRSGDRFAARSAEQTWLVGILKNKIVDHIRARARQRAHESPQPQAAHNLDLPCDPWFDQRGVWKVEVARWRLDPARVAEDHEFWTVFDACVTKLPAALADAFCLRELESLETPEVCKVLGITPSNLWTQLHRARALLRRCLEVNWFRKERH